VCDHALRFWSSGVGMALAVVATACATPSSTTTLPLASDAATAAAAPTATSTTATTTTTAPERVPSVEATRATLQAELLLLQGNVPAAIAELRAACRLDDRSPLLRVRLAETLLSSGDAEGASVAADDAIARAAAAQNDPGMVDALRARAAARAVLGDGDGARASLVRALQVSPGHPEASAQLAAQLVADGALSEAEAVVEAWMGRAPGAVDGWVSLARVFADRGEVDRAFVHLQRALTVRDDDDDALRLRRDLLLATGRLDDAARAARALADVDDDGDDVRVVLLATLALSLPAEARALARAWIDDNNGESMRLLVADGFERAGLVDDALAVLAAEPARTKDEPRRASEIVQLERARLLLSSGRARDARALACTPDGASLTRPPSGSGGGDGAVARFAAALCARAMADDGDADGAVAALLSAVGDGAPAVRLLDALAVVAPRAAPSRQAAVRQTIQARARDLDDGDVVAAAFVLDAVGAFAEARALLEDRLRGRPDDAQLTLAWARLLERQAATTAQALASVELVERLIDRHGADVDALNFLAFALAEQDAHGEAPAPGPSSRRADDARAFAWRAVLRAPLSGAIVDTLGWAELARGDVDDAVATLRRATRLLPDDGEVWFHRAVAERMAVQQATRSANDADAVAALARARALLTARTTPSNTRLLRRLDALPASAAPNTTTETR
jgi:tetratricopeptide (TPR) repeat protein